MSSDKPPDNTDAWYNEGVYLEKLGIHKEALNAYNKALEIDPHNSKAWEGKINALWYLGRYEKMLKAYDKLLKIKSQDSLLLNAKAIELENHGKHEDAVMAFYKAIKEYDKVLEINPKYLFSWDEIPGNDNLRLVEFLKQILDFDWVKTAKIEKIVDGRTIRVFTETNSLLLKLNDEKTEVELKIDDCRTTEFIAKMENGKLNIYNPTNASALTGKGIALKYLGRYKEALEAYDKALEINPQYTFAYIYSAYLFFKLGNLRCASEKVNKALEIDKDKASAFELQGRIKIEELDYDGASKCFRKAVSLDLGNPRIILWNAYANYLELKFSSDSKDERYQKEDKKYQGKILSIIRTIERADRLSKDEEMRMNIRYFLGFFYYMIKDYYMAKIKLEECIQSKSIHPIKKQAGELLGYVWYYQIKPSWWQWWLYSPWYRWLKRIIFGNLLLSLLALLTLYPFIPSLKALQVNQTLYILLVAFLTAILVFPSIESIKAKDMEIKMRAPPKFVLSPPAIEEMIMKLESTLIER